MNSPIPMKDIGPIMFHVKILDSRHGSFADRLHRAIRDLEDNVRSDFSAKA